MDLVKPPADQSAAGPRRPQWTKSIRRRSNAPLPTPEQMKRQSDVLQSAWRHFGERGAAIAFLNTRHDGLEGQPLHLAVESAEGLQRVEMLLDQMTLKA